MTSSLLTNRGGKSTNTRPFHVAGMPISAIVLLVISAAIELVWSHYFLLWGDEFGALLASSIPGLARLIHIQLTRPVSTDAIGYVALLHVISRLFGSTAFVMRLPSMGGYLLMQICLFYFVRRIAGERAATFALGFPALFGPSIYGIQCRPYAVLLGLTAVVMLTWQTAARRESKRTGALVALALSMALAITMHYYAVLMLVPLCAAEATRILERRRLDIPMLVAISAGMAGLLISLPFAEAILPFRANHPAWELNFHFIVHAYFWLIFGYQQLSVSMQHLISSGFALLALVAAFIHLRLKMSLRLPPAEAVFLFTLAGLPVFGYLLAKFFTHFVEARYIQPAMIGIAALIAILMAPVLQSKAIYRVLLGLLLVAIAGVGVLHIQSNKDQGQKIMAALVMSPATQRRLDAFPAQPVYLTDLTAFYVIGHYSPSAEMRSRIRMMCVDVSDPSQGGSGADIVMLSVNMCAAGVRNIVTPESVLKPGTEHLFLLTDNQWEGSDWALRASHLQVNILGHYFGEALVLARVP